MRAPAIEILELTDTRINGTINRNAFECWVDENDLREWVYTVSNEQGDPDERTGLYSWEEYYDGGGAEFDLYNYIHKKESLCQLILK